MPNRTKQAKTTVSQRNTQKKSKTTTDGDYFLYNTHEDEREAKESIGLVVSDLYDDSWLPRSNSGRM